jgi:lysophospholipase L1-like esterase
MTRLAGPASLAALAALTLAVLTGPAAPAAADARGGFYLDLGASVSLGVQPTGGVPREAATAEGYANDLVAEQAALGDPLRLVQLGCPGETVTALVAGDHRCYRAPDSQLAEAVAFLRDHADERGLVTVDVGFDDVDTCLWHRTVDPGCVDAGLDAVADQLPPILDALRDAAGPDVRLIGIGAYDPFLADARDAPPGPAFALASEAVIDRLNSTLSAGFGSAGVPMVDVAPLFSGPELRGGEDAVTLAAAAQHTCSLTWMCAAAPFGPNIHPNAEGYATIAGALEAKVGHSTDW